MDLLAALPPEIRDRITEWPITFERKPHTAMAVAGIHPDFTMGLFTGVPFSLAVAVSQRLPPHIILFLENLWAAA